MERAYTGINDVTGRKIYAGDKVHEKYSPGYIFIVQESEYGGWEAISDQNNGFRYKSGMTLGRLTIPLTHKQGKPLITKI